MTLYVWAEVDVAGLHNWPTAPHHRSYLATTHRHLFKIRATIVVSRATREVEFHDLRDMITDWWGEGLVNQGNDSCEVLARALANHLREQHRLRVASVSVSEDGEAGAVYCPD